jgi:hypothetical protein
MAAIPVRGGDHPPGAGIAAAAGGGQDRQRRGEGRDGALPPARTDRLRRAHRAPAAAAGDDLRHHGRPRDADLRRDTKGATQHAWFYEGTFTVDQTTGAAPITTLTLAGALPVCAKGRGRP